VVASCEHWDMLSRKWRQRKLVQKVGLYILDNLHLLDATYEVVASRIRFMQSEVERKIRVVALSSSLANAKDVANWLGVSFPANCFNFHPSVRPNPLEIHIQGFDNNNRAVRIIGMHRPAYNALKKAIPTGGESQGIVFVADRKQARLSALDFVTMVSAEASAADKQRFLGAASSSHEYQSSIEKMIKEPILKQTLLSGVAYMHDGMSD